MSGLTLPTRDYSGINFSPFSNELEFARAVSTQYGSNWVPSYRDRMDKRLDAGTRPDEISPHDIIRDIARETRQIDVAKSGLKAKFRS